MMKCTKRLLAMGFLMAGITTSPPSIAQNCGIITSDSVNSTWNADGTVDVGFILEHQNSKGGGSKAVRITIFTASDTLLNNYCQTTTSSVGTLNLGPYNIPSASLSSLTLEWLGRTTACSHESGSTCTGATITYFTYLPVELINFYGYCKGDETILKWSTSSETNNDHFIVETYVNNEWTADGQILGAGSTTEVSHYQYVTKADSRVYQLISKDYDGKEHVYNVTKVDCKNQEVHHVVFFPNPSKTEINFSEPLNNVVIKDLYGKTLEIDRKNGLTSLDVSQFKEGIYIIYFDRNESRMQSKIIVQ